MISGNYHFGGNDSRAALDAPHCGIPPSGPKTIYQSKTEAPKVNFEQFEPTKPNFEQFDRKLR